ncbi:MAG: nucleotide exchange factor GrpE [Calditrichaeota bacterium]|nr:MAG: nucleotide exchange factor GrpE [Calditrichota bacterium]
MMKINNEDLEKPKGFEGDQMSEQNNQSQPEEERDTIQKLEQALHECEDKYKRLAADYANYKKRVETEWAQVRVQAEDRCLQDILTIYDEFLRMKNHKMEPHQVIEAVEAIQKKWQQWLDRNLITIINPKGQNFDHHEHEAVLHQPVEDPELDGKVVQVIEYGYKRGRKILRHAKVAVGKFEAKESKQEPVEIKINEEGENNES